MQYRTILLLGALLTAGCGGSDDDGASTGGGGTLLTAATAASVEGVYQMTALSENQTGCDASGTDLLATATETYFALVHTAVLGQEVLYLVSCTDVADCQTRAAAMVAMQPTMANYSITLSEQQSADVITGFTAWSGFEENGMCVDREYEQYTMTRTGTSVTVEGSTVALADRAPEDGYCMADPAAQRQEAAGAPCVSSLSISGDRVADL
jgi:hypothetical protein